MLMDQPHRFYTGPSEAEAGDRASFVYFLLLKRMVSLRANYASFEGPRGSELRSSVSTTAKVVHLLKPAAGTMSGTEGGLAPAVASITATTTVVTATTTTVAAGGMPPCRAQILEHAAAPAPPLSASAAHSLSRSLLPRNRLGRKLMLA